MQQGSAAADGGKARVLHLLGTDHLQVWFMSHSLLLYPVLPRAGLGLSSRLVPINGTCEIEPMQLSKMPTSYQEPGRQSNVPRRVPSSHIL